MSTREAIIHAATYLFAEKGYEGMTMKEIAKKVGITPPAVYAFFKNKEDLFLQIYQEVISGHLEIAAYNMQENKGKTVKELLEVFLQEIIEFQLKEPLYMKIYMRLLLFPPDVFEKDLKQDVIELERKEYAMLAQLFEQGIANGEIKDGDVHLYTTTMLCIMDGLFWGMQRQDEEAIRRRSSEVLEHYWNSIAK